MAYGVKIYSKICEVCEKPLQATREKEKCHVSCREEYYRRYHKKRYSEMGGGKQSVSRIARARKAWHLNEFSCEVPGCGYTKGIKEVNVERQGKAVLARLCPNHWFELRCGYIEPESWAAVVIAEKG